MVLQKALCLSRDRSEAHLRQFEICTAGITFLGTPHNGSDLAGWGVIATKFISKFKDANAEIVGSLERDSEVLRDTQDTFGQLLKIREGQGKGILITCFFEENAVTGVGLVCWPNTCCQETLLNRSLFRSCQCLPPAYLDTVLTESLRITWYASALVLNAETIDSCRIW